MLAEFLSPYVAIIGLPALGNKNDLTYSAEVTNLNKDVKKTQGHNHNGKDGRGNQDHDDGADHAQQCEEEHAHGARDDLIDGVNVFRETV